MSSTQSYTAAAHGQLFDDSAAFEDDPFFDVPRQRIRLSTIDVMMPALCRDVLARALLWRVAADAVAAKLPTTGLRPLRVAGQAVVMLSFFRYPYATVGAYEEVGLLVMARSEQRFRTRCSGRGRLHRIAFPATGLAAVELALDNDVARVGGVELLGLAKYPAVVSHELSGDRFSFGVSDPASGAQTLAVTGRVGAGVAVPSPRLVNVSAIAGDVVRAEVDVECRWRVAHVHDVRVACDPHDGHLGAHVADLGLDTRRPLAVLTTDSLRGRLNLAVRLRDGQAIGDVVRQTGAV